MKPRLFVALALLLSSAVPGHAGTLASATGTSVAVSLSYPAFATTFVPEPGTLLLLSGAALALVLRARRRAPLRFGWWG